MADPQQQWYKMQVEGKWYTTQATSVDEARDKISGFNQRSKPLLPAAQEALRTIPRPQPPEAGFLDQATDVLTSMHVTPMDYSVVSSMRPSGRPHIGDPTAPDPATQWMGGPREMARGAEQFAEPEAEEKKFGAARFIGGTMQTATPLMLAGGVTAPVAAGASLLGAEVGSRLGEYGARRLGWSPGSQALSGVAGGLIGGAAAGGGEFYREHYLNLVEAAKSEMRANRPFGATVDEAQLQSAAEAKVQTDIAKGNSLPELSKEAAHALIRAAQAGAFTPRDKTLLNQVGEGAKSAPTIKAPDQNDLLGRVKALQAQLEQVHQEELAKTRPVTPVERTSQMIEQARIAEEAGRRADVAKAAAEEMPTRTKMTPEEEGALIMGGQPHIARPSKLTGEVAQRKVDANVTIRKAFDEYNQDRNPQSREKLRQTILANQADASPKLVRDTWAQSVPSLVEQTREGNRPLPPESPFGPMTEAALAKRSEEKFLQKKAASAEATPEQAAAFRQKKEAFINQAGLYWDVYTKSWRPVEEASRPLPPPGTTKEKVGPEWVQPSKLEGKQLEMRQRQEVEQAKTAETEDLLAQTRAARKKELADLREQSKTTPEMAAPPEVAKPAAEPVQAAEAPKGSGKPVRSTKGSEVTSTDLSPEFKQRVQELHNQGVKPSEAITQAIAEFTKTGRKIAAEPRSLRGDLGERPAKSDRFEKAVEAEPEAPKTLPPMKAADFKARLELFRARVDNWMKEHPGVAKTRAQEIVAEQMKKERGAFGGLGPEDIRARREAKINEWIQMLRSEKASPQMLDTAFKMLKAYGLEDDEILRKVGIEPPQGKVMPKDIQKDIEARKVGETEEHPPMAGLYSSQERGQEPGFIGKMVDRVADIIGGGSSSLSPQERANLDALAGKSVTERNVSEALRDIEQATKEVDQSKDVTELNKMFNLRDERGFWRMMPAKKIRPRPVSPDALGELTNKLEQSIKAVPPDDSRMKFSERLDKAVTEGWDKTQIALGKMAAHAVAMKDMYLREPDYNDYKAAVGRFSGSLNRSAWTLHEFTRAIKDKLPDQGRREAITNWIQANGDDATLADRAKRSKGPLRAGYEAARTLTQDEKTLAQFIIQHFDKRLNEAIKLGILHDGIENYVPQVWKAKDQTGMANYFSNITHGGLLKPDFNSAKHRIFDSYFEGEQAGRKPVNKDIGFLVASWDKAFNQALASRTFIRDLSKATAKDGRPLVTPSGMGRALYENTTPLPGETPDAYFIYPKATPEETGDYRAVNHPALTKWTWVTKDGEGAPIYMKGDLRVHPEFAQKLDNIINRGKWASQHPVQTAILKGGTFFKQTLLAMSPFHQIQEGNHAIFHKVNPFNPPSIDLANPSVNKLLDHGLVIGNFDPVAAFEEGLTSGGLVGKLGSLPGILHPSLDFGRYLQKYNEYLFTDYIPRLKTKMATEAYERNLHRYSDDVAQGKITVDQIAELTANQANAAFGELNYVMMGRNPQTQAFMRMAFLAPDFLEARARFVGQALKPYGREQYAALLRGAAGLYLMTRVLNKVLDDDYHWDEDPFSVHFGGYKYTIRTLPGDVWHLMNDPNSFLLHRLNPALVRSSWEFAMGRDDFGRKRNFGEQVLDTVRGMAPIPSQPFFRSGAQRGGLEERLISGVLGGVGITRAKARTKAGALAHQYALDGMSAADITSHHVMDVLNDIQDGHLDGNKIGKLLIEGKMNPRDVQTAFKLAQMPEIYRDYYRLPVEQKAKVFAAASPKEKALIMSYSKRELDTTRLLPEQREEFMKDLANPQ